MTSGGYTSEAPPDPMALFGLQNEVSKTANVFAFQKNFGMNAKQEKGQWGFDVFYENLDGLDDASKGFDRESALESANVRRVPFSSFDLLRTGVRSALRYDFRPSSAV
jgi:hypothetical protein